ncbi:MAG: gliding motility-associated ABC transporter substrate-binding protein GldG [Bacteroidota bacterium]
MMRLEQKKRQRAIFQFLLVLAALFLINLLANGRIGNTRMYTAFDLTQDKRYSLTEHTEELLDRLDQIVYVEVLMEGDFPATYERLRASVRSTLEDMRSQSSYIEYRFTNPIPEGENSERTRARQQSLAEDGIVPVTLVKQSATERGAKQIYPYAILNYNGRTEIAPLMNSQPGQRAESTVEESISRLEYNISSALERLLNPARPLVTFSTGRGELPPVATADLEARLRQQYEVGRLSLDSLAAIPQEVKLVIIAKPTIPFSDKDLFKIDQYIMNGGKVLWSVDGVAMDLDSLRTRNEYYPSPYELNLNDLFYRYGLRVNGDLVLELENASTIPIRVGSVNGNPQIENLTFPYHVVATPRGDHPIIKNVDPIDLRFPSSIDLDIGTPNPIDKTILLMSSNRARYQRLPAAIDLDVQKYSLDADRFNRDSLVMGVLLEGTFTSPYANRVPESFKQTLSDIGQAFKSESVPNRMIVVSDGDLLANVLDREGKVSPLGFNPYHRYLFDNKDLALNMIEYLLDDGGVVASRGKQVRLRLLDRVAAQEQAGFWRMLNIGLPLIILIVFGFGFNYLRRRKYGRK